MGQCFVIPAVLLHCWSRDTKHLENRVVLLISKGFIS